MSWTSVSRLLALGSLLLLSPLCASESLTLDSLYLQPVAVISRDLRDAHGPKHIVFCADISGSMTGAIGGQPGSSRQQAAGAACAQLLRQIAHAGDIVSVINFAQQPTTVVDGMAAEAVKPEGLVAGSFSPSTIADIREQRGTNVIWAHHVAVEQARRRSEELQPVVIMFTDGYCDPPPAGTDAFNIYTRYNDQQSAEYRRWKADLQGVACYVIGDETGLVPRAAVQPAPEIHGRIAGSVLFENQTDTGPVTIIVTPEQAADGSEAPTEELPPTVTATADNQWCFEVAGLKPGTYQLLATAESFPEWRQIGLVVNPGQSTPCSPQFAATPPPTVWIVAAVLLLLFLPWPVTYEGRRYWTAGLIPLRYRDVWVMRLIVLPKVWERALTTTPRERDEPPLPF